MRPPAQGAHGGVGGDRRVAHDDAAPVRPRAGPFDGRPAALQPLQAPAQLMKDAPESGTATRWTCAPAEYWALQLPRQSAPAPRTSPVPDVVRRRLTLVGSVRPDPPPELDPHPATRPAATQTRMNGARIASPTGSVDTRTAADKPDGRPSLTGKQASVRAASVAFQGPHQTARGARRHRRSGVS